MTILDRYLLRSLLVNYLIALGVMVGLYVVLDLFFNLDEFTENDPTFSQLLSDLAGYYGVNLFRYFAQISGVITLFACLVTVARMRRNNELTAMLASGVSLYRVAFPAVAFGLFTTVIWLVDVELLVPRVAHRLARTHDDAAGARTYGIWFLEDQDGALVSAMQYIPGSNALHQVMIMRRDPRGKMVSVIEADRAQWRPGDTEDAGTWLLERGFERVRAVSGGSAMEQGESLKMRTVHEYPSVLTPAKIELRQSATWVFFLSSRQLRSLASGELPPALAAPVQQARHVRFTTPIVNMVLLLLGLPILLHRQPGNILTDAGKCVGVCGACFVTGFMGQSIASIDTYSALPAWLPIIIFMPIAVILIDRMRT